MRLRLQTKLCIHLSWRNCRNERTVSRLLLQNSFLGAVYLIKEGQEHLVMKQAFNKVQQHMCCYDKRWNILYVEILGAASY